MKIYVEQHLTHQYIMNFDTNDHVNQGMIQNAMIIGFERHGGRLVIVLDLDKDIIVDSVINPKDNV